MEDKEKDTYGYNYTSRMRGKNLYHLRGGHFVGHCPMVYISSTENIHIAETSRQKWPPVQQSEPLVCLAEKVPDGHRQRCTIPSLSLASWTRDTFTRAEVGGAYCMVSKNHPFTCMAQPMSPKQSTSKLLPYTYKKSMPG